MAYTDNALPLNIGKVNLTSGVYQDGVYVAVEDGELTVVWKDNLDSDVISCIAGQAFRIVNSESVTISSGKFHRA